MKIELAFPDISNDIKGAVVDIRIEDQSEADAPSLRLASKRIDLLTISSSQSLVTVEVDLDQNNLNNGRELVVIARVKGQTSDNQSIEFLNTTTAPLPTELNGSMRIVLSRIR